MKLRIRMVWRAWLVGLFFGPNYLAGQLGPLVVMLEFVRKMIPAPPKPPEQMTKEDWDKFEEDCKSK